MPKKKWGRGLTSDMSHEKTWTCRRKKHKKETESLLIAAENNTITTNHIKISTDKMQQNSICSLHGDRGEIINNTIIECCKLAPKKYKARSDYVDCEKN